MLPAEQPIESRIELRDRLAPEDDAFLEELYFSTRDDLAGLFPDPEQSRTLISVQHRAQANAYAAEFPTADHHIVLMDGAPIGRMIVDRQDAVTVRFVDIALLPDFRSRGIGGILIDRLLDECDATGRDCLLHVRKDNRAQMLYARMGFTIDGETATHFAMRRVRSAG